jgi:L-fuculose-phosphate aldolase
MRIGALPTHNGDADLSAAREEVVSACRDLSRGGLTYGTSGNVSVRRDASHFVISPSGIASEHLQAEDIALMDLDGHWRGTRRPSSEWRFHRDIYRSREAISAVVHTHSVHATALACTGQGIPAFHYMVAVAGGPDIRCAAYHTFGTEELSGAVLEALDGRMACLLGNHGVIACGSKLVSALALAGEVENLARQYCAALQLGQVRVLDDAEMQRVLEKFRTYGKPDAVDSDLKFCGP